MKRIQTGHRRLNTPQNRLKRAVAYRYASKAKKHTTLQKTENTIKSFAAHASTAIRTENRNIVQKVVKPTRKEARNAWLHDIVMQPNASFWKSVFHPLKTMQKAKDTDVVSLGYFKGFLWHLLAWLMFSGCIAHFYQRSIELNAYSLARFNFTDTCWLAVRITLFGLILEYLAYLVIYAASNLTHQSCSLSKIMEGDALSAPLTAMVFLLSLLILMKFYILGMLLFIVAVGIAGAWKVYSLHEMSGYSWKFVVILAAAYVAAGFCLYGIYYETAMQDLVEIYKLL
jgi:hypothetical protein